MLSDLETLTCSHLRLQDAQLRAAHAQRWLIAPLAAAVFTVMAWWGGTRAAAPVAPLALLAALLAIAAGVWYALSKGQEAAAAARELSAFHHQVLLAVDPDEGTDAAQPGKEPHRATFDEQPAL